MAPEIHREIRLRKTISEHSDRVLAQNFEAVLAVIAMLAKTSYLQKLPGGVETHSKTPIRETHIQGLKYTHSYDTRS